MDSTQIGVLKSFYTISAIARRILVGMDRSKRQRCSPKDNIVLMCFESYILKQEEKKLMDQATNEI